METDKEKITRLETRISELHSRNAGLRFENEQLRRQLGITDNVVTIDGDAAVIEGEIRLRAVLPLPYCNLVGLHN